MLVINCSNCRTPVQLRSGARSIRCAFCRTVTHIDDARAARPLPPASQVPLSPYNNALLEPPPNAHSRKRAVICGISYKNSRHELKGSINDAKCTSYLLVNMFRFPQDSILMLTGEDSISGRRRSGVRKETSGGEAICFSGCDDDQESADISALSNGKTSGAMASSFIRAFDRGRGSTYGSILGSMQSTIRSSGNFTGGHKRQETQLTTSEPFDVYSRPSYKFRVHGLITATSMSMDTYYWVLMRFSEVFWLK